MPYLKDTDRHRLDELLYFGTYMETPGHLNYAITLLMISYLERKDDLSYANIAETLAGGTEAVNEFRRRVLVPYEDKKIKENGDVYPDYLITTGEDDELS